MIKVDPHTLPLQSNQATHNRFAKPELASPEEMIKALWRRNRELELQQPNLSDELIHQHLRAAQVWWSQAKRQDSSRQKKTHELCRALIDRSVPQKSPNVKLILSDGELSITWAQLEILKLEFLFFRQQIPRHGLNVCIDRKNFNEICSLLFDDRNEFIICDLRKIFTTYFFTKALGASDPSKFITAVLDRVTHEHLFALIQLLAESEIVPHCKGVPQEILLLGSKRLFQLLTEMTPLSPEITQGWAPSFHELISFLKTSQLEKWIIFSNALVDFLKGNLFLTTQSLQQLFLDNSSLSTTLRLALLGTYFALGNYELFLQIWCSQTLATENFEREIIQLIREQLTANDQCQLDQEHLFLQLIPCLTVIKEMTESGEDQEMFSSSEGAEAPFLIRTQCNDKLERFNQFLTKAFFDNTKNNRFLDLFVEINKNDGLSYGALAVSIGQEPSSKQIDILLALFKYLFKTDDVQYKIFTSTFPYQLIDTLGANEEKFIAFHPFFEKLKQLGIDGELALLTAYLSSADFWNCALDPYVKNKLEARRTDLPPLFNRENPRSFEEYCRQAIDQNPGQNRELEMWAGCDAIAKLQGEWKKLHKRDPKEATLFLQNCIKDLNYCLTAQMNNILYLISFEDGMDSDIILCNGVYIFITLILRGQVYLTLGQLENAERDLTLVMTALDAGILISIERQEEITLLSALAYTYGLRGELEKAFDLFEKAQDLGYDPVSVERFMAIYGMNPQLQWPDSSWQKLYTQIRSKH